MLAALFMGLAAGFTMSLIFSIPVMLLWNWLMPALFHLPELTFLQAWGVLFLSALLFKSGLSLKAEKQ